jgi:uncharacterized protein (TIGR02246 family)
MGVDEDLSRRLRRLEDRAGIGELVARYCFAIDDRDVAAIADCFTADGCFRSLDGVLDARGREAVVEQFHGRFAALGATYHYTHDRVLEFDPRDPDAARGIVAAHAEVVRNGEPMWVALRYADRYRREDGRWRFAERELSFMYYLRVEEYVAALRGRERMRAYANAAAADWPEGTEGWRRYAPPRG